MTAGVRRAFARGLDLYHTSLVLELSGPDCEQAPGQGGPALKVGWISRGEL